MVFPRSGVTAALAAFALIGSALSVPLGDKLNNLSLGARDLLKRSIPAAPRFAAYSDKWVWPPPAAAELKVSSPSRTSPFVDATPIQGFNV